MLLSKGSGLSQTASLTFLILFSILFVQLAGAGGENLSISGTNFLDIDSNGIKAPSEPGLAGYTIYWDKDNNTRWDAGEDYVLTDENGKYNLSKLSNGTYIIRELVSSGNKFQPSSPRYGYYSVNLTDKNVTGRDFGNSIPLAIPEFTILILLGLFALFFIAAGLIVLYKGLSEIKILDGEQKGDKRTKIQILVASGFILLILGLYLLIIILQNSRNIAGGGTALMGNSYALVTPVVLTLLVFGVVLLMLYTQTKLKQKDDTGVMRKTIAGLLVVGLIAVVLFALNGTINNENQDIIIQYIQLVGIVIAFYFGTRATEDAYKGARTSEGKADEGDAKKDLDIKDVTYENSAISMSISNAKKRNFTLKGVSIKDGEKELFAFTYPEPGMPVSEALDPYMTGPLKVGKDEMDGFDTTREYTITIDTSIGQKSVTRKINGKTDKEETGKEKTDKEKTGEEKTGEEKTGEEKTGEEKTGEEKTGK
jgi:uncharacterized membrane protein YozB (DUF420 family)